MKFRLIAILLILGTLTTACHYSVIGDSRMVQIAAELDHDENVAYSGRGFNPTPFRAWDKGEAGFAAEWVDGDELVSTKDYVVLPISIHDASCRGTSINGPWDCSIDTSGYADLRDALSEYNVVVIEGWPHVQFDGTATTVPEDQMWGKINQRLASLSSAVETLYGCDALDWDILNTGTFDNIHYTAQAAQLAALRLEQWITPDDYCWTASP